MFFFFKVDKESVAGVPVFFFFFEDVIFCLQRLYMRARKNDLMVLDWY